MIAVIILIAAAIAFAGCGRQDAVSRGVEVLDSAGVRIVVNGGADATLDWRFEPILTLGGADDGPEAFFGIGEGSVGTDADGNFYVLDRGNHHVQVFDRNGRHLRTMGNQGGGPGELEWPQTLIVWPDGTAGVADLGKHGLVRFGPDGSPLDEMRLENWWGAGIAQVDGTLVAQQVRREGESSYSALVTVDADPRELLSRLRAPARPIDLGCGRTAEMSQIFTPSFVWSAGPDFIASTTAAEYVIDIHEGDTRTASVRRPTEPSRATLALALQEIGDNFGPCDVSAEHIVEQRGYADVIPAVGKIAVAPEGTLWVDRRGVPGEETPTDIFARGGEYLGTLPPGTPFPIAFTPEGHVIVVERDDLDISRVVVYRILAAVESAG